MNNETLKLVVVGGQRCGTTWLYSQLYKQFEGRINPLKEMHYWDVRVGTRRRLARLSPERLREAVKNINRANFDLGEKFSAHHALADYAVSGSERAYRRLCSTGGLSLDITPSYLSHSSQIVAQFKRCFGEDAGAIAILRNPKARIWSAYRYKLRKLSSKTSFAELFDSEMLQKSLYAKSLVGAREQGLRVVYFEDLIRGRERAIAALAGAGVSATDFRFDTPTNAAQSVDDGKAQLNEVLEKYDHVFEDQAEWLARNFYAPPVEWFDY